MKKKENINFLVKEAALTFPKKPGIYQMLNKQNEVLYVGKARILKSRISNYLNTSSLSNRIQKMLSLVESIECTITDHEASALLLEANMIKRLKPPYNILLRDDKSYPNILLRLDHKWPTLVKHRGKKNPVGKYFGPFASASAVNNTLNTIQKIFPLRSCSDSEFKNRSRPCLQHQIGRCSAPCVGKIETFKYELIVQEALNFLSGEAQSIQQKIYAQMEKASNSQEYERAAILRDRLRALKHIQNNKEIFWETVKDADVIAINGNGGVFAVQVFFFRGGKNFGNRTHFPSQVSGESLKEVLNAFIIQFYQSQTPPPVILLSNDLPNIKLMADALSIKRGKTVKIEIPSKGEKRKAVLIAINNAKISLARKIANKKNQNYIIKQLAGYFNLPTIPERIEVYDNSHIMGTHAVSSMIVATAEGFQKSSYRKFNLKLVEQSNDYSMMQEVINRRFKRLINEHEREKKVTWPDLIIIDGGVGHLNATQKVLELLSIKNVSLLAISKGQKRNSGMEKYHTVHESNIILDSNNPVHYYMQRLRDEAHRFAIGTHRNKRNKMMLISEIDSLPGIGRSKKKSLLLHFGATSKIKTASVEELQQADGISKKLAENIYNYFNADD